MYGKASAMQETNAMQVVRHVSETDEFIIIGADKFWSDLWAWTREMLENLPYAGLQSGAAEPFDLGIQNSTLPLAHFQIHLLMLKPKA